MQKKREINKRKRKRRAWTEKSPKLRSRPGTHALSRVDRLPASKPKRPNSPTESTTHASTNPDLPPVPESPLHRKGALWPKETKTAGRSFATRRQGARAARRLPAPLRATVREVEPLGGQLAGKSVRQYSFRTPPPAVSQSRPGLQRGGRMRLAAVHRTQAGSNIEAAQGNCKHFCSGFVQHVI